MKSGIEGFAGFEDAEGDMSEFAHHGTDNQFGRLTVGHKALVKAIASVSKPKEN